MPSRRKKSKLKGKVKYQTDSKKLRLIKEQL